MTPGLKAWEYGDLGGASNPSQMSFLKYPALKGRVSAGGRMKLSFAIFVLLVQIPLFAGRDQTFPIELRGVPFADAQGIVLGTKTILIRNVEAPYNAALTKDEKGNTLLFFRYDMKTKGFKGNYIACVALDEKLDQKSDVIKIDTRSDYSNDPRVFKAGPQFYLVFNDTVSKDPKERIMKIAELDMSNYQLKKITVLDPKLKKTEKNWVPFSDGKGLFFIYKIDPFVVWTLESSELQTLSENPGTPWEWGSPRGGTPAELIDGEYLTFFHSSFRDRHGGRWYTMGALTFQAHPPFKMTAISPCPILFQGIYSSKHLNGASRRLRCIFPSGFILSEDKSKILLSCGENDSSIKIITFDKEALLKSLVRLD